MAAATKEKKPAGYIRYPGGVSLHLSDGSVEIYAYGRPVFLDDLADYQQETVAEHLSDTPTKPVHELEARETLAENVPEDEFDAVPDDYNKLSESEALGVIRSYNRSPKKQGQVLAYEKLHQNRQTVLDGATPSGEKAAAEFLQEQVGPDADIPEPSSAD